MVAPLPNSGIPIFIELFAGRGSLSKSMIQAGFEVISVDHEVIQPLAPIVSLDLSSKDGQSLCWQIVTNPRVFAIHLGLPCGTSSRARDKPVPQSLRQQGAPSPMPLIGRLNTHLVCRLLLGRTFKGLKLPTSFTSLPWQLFCTLCKTSW